MKNQSVNFNIVFDKNDKFYVSIEKSIKAESLGGTEVDAAAIAALEPILGKGFGRIRELHFLSEK